MLPLRSRLALTLQERLEVWSIHERARFIAVSQAVAASYCAALAISPGRCEIIPNSVDLARFPRAAPADREPGAALRLINVGRHEAQKGVDTLLEAVAGLDSRTKITLELIGDGTCSPGYRQRARDLGIGEIVAWLGWKVEVSPYLAQAHAFVLPSRYEGLPLVLLEALAAGLPVIASDIPPHREVDPQGLATRFFPAGDSAALRREIAALAGDDALRLTLARRARELAKPYNIEAVGPRILRVLESSCG